MQQGEVCGAVTGAIMVLSLKYGYSEGSDTAAKENIRNLVLKLNASFNAKHGSLLCKELVGIDLSIQENMDNARKSGVFTTVCAGFVDDAIDILEDIIVGVNKK
jgi:C_GCAxxG_C_C family probable redox protein